LDRAMHTQLHGDLHHQTAQHESCIGPLACGR
jgi:hypothetical protein